MSCHRQSSLVRFLPVILSVLLFACGDEDPVSGIDAENAKWLGGASFLFCVMYMESAVITGVNSIENGSESLVSGKTDDFKIVGSVKNDAGSGLAKLTGTGGKTGDNWDYKYTAEFTGWTLGFEDSVKIDGKLLAETKIVPGKSTTKITGTPEISGSISGTATYDLTVAFRSPGVVTFSYCGKINDIDVSKDCILGDM